MNTRLLIIAVFLTFSTNARAQVDESLDDDGELPSEATPVVPRHFEQNLTQRPITMPALSLRVDFDVRAFRFGDMFYMLNLGAAFAILDDLEVGVSGERQGLRRTSGLVPLLVSPETEYLDPYVYARYRFLRLDRLEMGVEVGTNIPTSGDSVANLGVAVPFRARFGRAFSLDGGVQLGFLFADEIDVRMEWTVQPRLAPIDALYVGLNTGISTGFRATKEVVVPLGLEAGYVINTAQNVRTDLYLAFDMPVFFSSFNGGVDRTRDIYSEFWTITFGVRSYIGFGG